MPLVRKPLPWHAFHLPKRGNSLEEYEDAFAGSAEQGRFAVADGASESSFAGLWARLLVEGFVKEAKKPWEETDWLKPLHQRWVAEVNRQPLPWYAEMKRQEGAFATLLGFALRKPEHWRAVAVGDSCLIQIRAGRVMASFPLCESRDFGNQPDLICSRPPGAQARQPRLKKITGRWAPGDYFLLMTDALAQWFLSWHEQKRQPWEIVQPLLTAADPDADFAALVATLREQGELRNDDVTLLLAESPHTQARRPDHPPEVATPKE